MNQDHGDHSQQERDLERVLGGDAEILEELRDVG